MNTIDTKNNSMIAVTTDFSDTAPFAIGFLFLGSLSLSPKVLYINPAANAGTNGKIKNRAYGEFIKPL